MNRRGGWHRVDVAWIGGGVTALLPFVVAVLCLAVFATSFLADRRRLRNGFYLFFFLVFLALTLLLLLASVSTTAASVVLFGLLTLIPVLVLALGVFLLVNGVTMVRREGRRLPNLLSLAAGVGIVAFVPVNLAVAQIDWVPVRVARSSANLILAYVAFVFVCFLLYSVVYGRLRTRRSVDFVVVLGAGLRGGREVSPLLASRLNRGRRLFDAERAAGGDPYLITSGGRGPDEQVSEAQAMAEYLVARGVPRDRVLLEDRSTSTFENLAYSGEIMRERGGAYRSVVVTNNFHVLRAALIARRAEVDAQVVGSPTAWYFWPSATIREFVAVLVDHRVVHAAVCVLIVLGQVAITV